MRFWTAAVALFASVAFAQQNAINIPEGQSTLDVIAGQPVTITWTNPSSGTVTIKLQESGPNITPDSGITVASAIPASAGTTTFTVQPGDVNSFQYTIEIIDDTNPTNINFSPNFGIQGATGTAVGSSTASVTGSTASTTATDSTASTGSTTATDSTASITSSATTTDSTASASSTSDSTSSEESSSTSSSASASETTSAPSSDNGAGSLNVQGGLVAAVAVAIALL